MPAPLTRTLALICSVGFFGCNFTMEPDPGAAEPSVFDDPINDPNEVGSAMGGEDGNPTPTGSSGGDMSDPSLLDSGLPEDTLDASEPVSPEVAVDGGLDCADADGDGLCDGRDPVCNRDDSPLICMAAPPVCADEQVPEVEAGCYTARCVTWAECSALLSCDDADRDGLCDDMDDVCNADDQVLSCDVAVPECPADVWPVVREGCYTGACLPWAACAELARCPDLDRDGQCDEEAVACAQDGDCPDGSWCRPTLAGATHVCVAFQAVGQACGGFTIPSEALRCAPTSICADQDRRLPDGPGVCRTACDPDGLCPDGAYCGVNGACRDHGACFLPVDCLQRGNLMEPAPACDGWPQCTAEGQCQWQCGDPRCVDLTGIEFGDCAEVLGVARIDGVCLPVSGCSPAPYGLFDTLDACLNACP